MIPGPVTPADRLLEQLRLRYPDRRFMKVPWGWNSYTPGSEDDVYAPTLAELAERLAGPPAGGPPQPGRA